MISQEELDLIHKYLENDLNPEETILFKEYFTSNKEFSKEVKRFTDIKIALQAASAASLKKKIEPKIIRFNWARVAYAASVILIIGFGTYFIYTGTQQPFHQQLYAEYFDNPFANGEEWVTRSGLTDEEKDALKDIEHALYFMEQKEFDKAIDMLTTFNHTDHSIIMDDVEWFLALAYLRTGRIDEAKELLEIIQSSNSKYSEKAWELYEEF